MLAKDVSMLKNSLIKIVTSFTARVWPCASILSSIYVPTFELTLDCVQSDVNPLLPISDCILYFGIVPVSCFDY